MIKEEMLYEDALDVLDKALQGKAVDQTTLGLASIILQPVWTKIYEERIKREALKAANEWKEEIE
jgi:hypothetical protein